MGIPIEIPMEIPREIPKGIPIEILIEKDLRSQMFKFCPAEKIANVWVVRKAALAANLITAWKLPHAKFR